MVIMIDKSKHMKDQFGDDTRMYFAIQAAKSVIDSLNPYDNVRVQELLLWFEERITKYRMHFMYDHAVIYSLELQLGMIVSSYFIASHHIKLHAI